MEEFRFQKFKVYQDAKQLYRLTILLTKKFSRDFDHLADQLRRAALSIVLNIAEGSGKRSDRDFNRYIGISLGSISELVAGFDIAQQENLITESDYSKLIKLAVIVRNQLGGLSKKLSVVG